VLSVIIWSPGLWKAERAMAHLAPQPSHHSDDCSGMAVASSLLTASLDLRDQRDYAALDNHITVEARAAVQVSRVRRVFRRTGVCDCIRDGRPISHLNLAGSPAKSQNFALQDSSPQMLDNEKPSAMPGLNITDIVLFHTSTR
jgi:hypothetical protein